MIKKIMSRTKEPQYIVYKNSLLIYLYARFCLSPRHWRETTKVALWRVVQSKNLSVNSYRLKADRAWFSKMIRIGAKWCQPDLNLDPQYGALWSPIHKNILLAQSAKIYGALSQKNCGTTVAAEKKWRERSKNVTRWVWHMPSSIVTYLY